MPFADLFDHGAERDMLCEHVERQHGFRHLTLALTVNGAPRWWTISAQRMQQGGMRGVASDVTAQKRAEERVSYMAHYDGLTDLANRFQFSDALKHAITRCRRDDQVVVLYLDLDSFKAVNDTLGHPIGDKLLCSIARKIELVAQQDMTVARLGGDEFAVLVAGRNAVQDASELAGAILTSIAQPIIVDSNHVITTVSIGIAHRAFEGADADTLMKQADLALYAAKAAGRNQFAFYVEGMDQAAEQRRELELDLRASLTNDNFELYYQPLVNLETSQTIAYEALLRWNHPERGIVMPEDFIPVAEETGLIVQLGEWVIRQATAEVAKWPDHLRVSVNLSPIQMRSANLIPTVINAIASAGIDPSRLELEITENVLLQDSEVNIATLHKLRDFGVRISLDDFGTGYSSLNYLRSFPFDKIKIDRCFVTDLDNNPECQAIIEAVTGLARNLGITTTAEGVEELGQLDRLKMHGCTEAQGYLFSRPERSDVFTDLRAPLTHDHGKAPVIHFGPKGEAVPPAADEPKAGTSDKGG